MPTRVPKGLLTESRYHGAVCARGHDGLRYRSTGTCVMCDRIAGHKYRETHREQERASNRERYRRMSPEARLNMSLMDHYGIGVTQYRTLLGQQEGRCAVCSRVITHAPVVDHDHTTSQVRGLLCRRCNTLIGYLETAGNDVVARAVRYVEMHRASG